MKFGAALAVLVLAASAADAQAAPRLKAFGSCADLVAFARKGALRTNGGVGVLGRAGDPAIDTVVTPPMAKAPAGEIPPSAAQPVSAGGGAGTDFSTTNVQEAGVDEPDVVKTDGRRIFAVTDGTLRIVDVSGAAPRVAGTLKLAGYDQRLLVRDDRVLAI